MQILSAEDDALSYLYQLTPNAEGVIKYHFDMNWRKSEWLSSLSDEELLTDVLAKAKAAAEPIVVERVK